MEELRELVNEITRPLVGPNLDTKLEAWLNAELPPASAIYRPRVCAVLLPGGAIQFTKP
ncbi:MAG TPA: hypothetical protein VN326_24610 [Casimicrobiaceae bacterium]|nr:hypothetical protein [Casimicrobiaceae bacterium]